MRLPAAGPLPLELALMVRVGERQPARERPAVPGGKLAGVQHRGGHLGLGDAQLDPPAGERRIDGVVIAIDAKIRLLRDPNHRPSVGVRQLLGQRSHPHPLLDEPLGRDGADRAMHPLVDPVTPAVELVLEVEVVGEAPCGLEV